LIWQTYGQRWSRVVGSKRQVLAFFSVRICYMFLTSKCRRESDLSLFMRSVLAERMRVHSADFRRILRSNIFSNQKSALCSGILFASTKVIKVMHRSQSHSPLYFDNTRFERWPQICCIKIIFEWRLNNSNRWFISTKTNLIKSSGPVTSLGWCRQSRPEESKLVNIPVQ